jgi:AhpD family alkylhydroperoxidase
MQHDVLSGVAKIEAGIDRDLPPALRELARYKASQINECKCSADCRRTAALRAGISERQLEAIDDYVRDGMFSDQQKTVLAYAEQLTRTANVEPTIVKKLKRFLDERQLVTLAAAVALTNFTDRVTHGLDVESP